MITYNELYDLVKHNSDRPKIDAAILYGLMVGRLDPRNHSIGDVRYRQCYNPPSREDMILHIANHILGADGVESGELPNGEYLDYCNAGDTYNATLCYHHGEYDIASCGDIYEDIENTLCEEIDDPKIWALYEVLTDNGDDIKAYDIIHDYDTTYTANGAEYLVLTETERDEAFREACESYLDDCCDIPENIRYYIDIDKYCDDVAMSDGHGHVLSPYDGCEYESIQEENYYYIYRIN